jgi:PAS domain-containing protein
MLRSHISLAVRHCWLLTFMAGIACLGASLAVMNAVNADHLTVIPVLPAKTIISVMLTLLGLSAAGAFVIFRQRQQIRLSTAALDNMPQGLCMLDSSAQLMLCNERYLEL